MISKEITELRKSGQLEEALRMANKALDEEPDNIWNKRAAAWVYYDYLKKYNHPDSYDQFTGYLIKIKNLELPEDEKMVFDKCAWQTGSMVFSLAKEWTIDYDKINQLFEIIREFSFIKPSEAYTFLYKAFHKISQNWPNYLEFADWWNFDHFRPEDYLKEEYEGKRIISVAEQAFIAYSKKLTEGRPADIQEKKRDIDNEKISAFMSKLDRVIEEHPDLMYLPYSKAKLLIASGNPEEAFSALLPFARQKKNEYWVWELMAEIFSGDKNIVFACFCKALNTKASDEYLVKLRQNFADILIGRQMYNEAKTEIQQIIKTRENNQWKLPNEIKIWTEQPWYIAATARSTNKELYRHYLKKAEDLLFKDIPEEIIAVEFVNSDKKMLHFVKNHHKSGFFNYSESISKTEAGDILKVRFNGAGDNGYYKIFTAKKTDPNENSDAIKNFEGTLKLIHSRNYGFIEDVFFDPKFVQTNNLSDGQTIKGIAILSFNKRTNKWGWKAIKIK